MHLCFSAALQAPTWRAVLVHKVVNGTCSDFLQPAPTVSPKFIRAVARKTFAVTEAAPATAGGLATKASYHPTELIWWLACDLVHMTYLKFVQRLLQKSV